MEVKGFEPPQEELIPVRRSARTHQAPERLCLNVEVEEHSLGDLNEPANYKAASMKASNLHLGLKVEHQEAGIKDLMRKSKDDKHIMGNHISSLQSVKTYLGKCFAMKDLGEAKFILESRSTEIEAEYIAASEAEIEVVWIRKFISRLGIVPTINELIKMFCDNSATLLIANEQGVQRGAKHYHRRCHYVREYIELGKINLLKVHTDDNVTDSFTKALPKGKLTQHARSMGLLLVYNKIGLLVQQYEQFTILEEESIDSALDEGFSSKNYVRKFLRALHPKWRAKVTAIEESKDLSSLALDELIGNLKVHEVVMEKEFEIYKGKKERVKSIALKAKKESSNQEKKRSHSDKGMRRKERVTENALDAVIQIISLAIIQNQPYRNKDQKALLEVSWIDTRNDVEDKTNDTLSHGSIIQMS
ncbi:hypothetical protein Tco_0123585 [Tanacetum coccineum]